MRLCAVAAIKLYFELSSNGMINRFGCFRVCEGLLAFLLIDHHNLFAAV